MPTRPTPDAVVRTAPDGGTSHLAEAVDHSLGHLATGAVLGVPGDPVGHLDLAEWCLSAGAREPDPFDGWGHLLIGHPQAAQRAA
ncbi:MAG: hypothetical protein AAGA93_17980 [Actinomycetota bacterium]